MSVTRIVHRHGRRFEVETLNPDAPAAKRSKQFFIRVPLDLIGLAAKATGGQRLLVWQLILHRCWRERAQTVPVTNAMVFKYGISPDVKVRALRQLVEAGLITVEWRDRKTPIVTVHL